MQKNTIVFNCLEHDLASYSMIVFIGKCKIISKYFPKYKDTYNIISYKISTLRIYEYSFVAKILRDDCTLNIF